MTQEKVTEKPLNKAMAIAELQKLNANELYSLLRFKEKFSEQEESNDFVQNLSEMQQDLLNSITWFDNLKEIREARSLFFDMCLQYATQEENEVYETERNHMYGIFQLINY